MNDDQRGLLVIVSRLLAYPAESSESMKEDFEQLAEDLVSSTEVKEDIKKRWKLLFQLKRTEIQELYVETFDLKSKTGLYLTAYELGDSNFRGAALIRLQKIVNQAGFERDNDELADYIPMLLQFLAVAPSDDIEYGRLIERLGVAINYMKERMSEDNPYHQIIQILTDYVFAEATEEELKELESGRKEADLEELPYPIMYQ
jgi:nitrate reductase delta subunit